jgi:hypothetical protein
MSDLFKEQPWPGRSEGGRGGRPARDTDKRMNQTTIISASSGAAGASNRKVIAVEDCIYSSGKIRSRRKVGRIFRNVDSWKGGGRETVSEDRGDGRRQRL